MDLAELSKIDLELPKIGTVSTNLTTFGVLNWIQKGDWTNGHDFLRDLITQYVIPENVELDAASLDTRQLDEIAVDIWTRLREKNLIARSLDKEPKLVENADELLAAYKNEIERYNQRIRESFKQHTQSIHYAIETHKQALSRINEVQALRKSLEESGVASLTRAMDALQPTAVSEVQRLAEMGERIADSIRPTVMMWERMSKEARALDSIGEAFRSTQLASELIANQLRPVALASDSISRRISESLRFQQSYLTEALRLPGFEFTAQSALSGLVARSAATEILANYYRDTEGARTPFDEALATLHSMDETDDHALDDDDLNELTERITTQVLATQGSAISWLHPQMQIQIVMVIMMAVSLWLQYRAPTASQMNLLLEQQATLIEIQKTDIETNLQRYRNDRRVKRPYHLREAADANSPSLAVLNSDQIVTVIKTDGNWAYVEVLPYANEESLFGWVFRGGLEPLGL